MRRLFAFHSRSARACASAAHSGLAAGGLWCCDLCASSFPYTNEHPSASRDALRHDPCHQDLPGNGQQDQGPARHRANGTRVRAYVCDSTPSRLATLAEWLTGQVSEGLVQASSLDQQARLTGDQSLVTAPV